MFYIGKFPYDWESARVYCSDIFQGYQRADVLYFNETNDIELKQFINNMDIGHTSVEYQTNTLCCPILAKHHQNDITKMIICRWLVNRQIIDSKYYSHLKNLNSDSCKFLTVEFNSKFKFNNAYEVSEKLELKFICRYKKPDYCL